MFYNLLLLDEENKPFMLAHINQYKIFLQTHQIPYKIKHFRVKHLRYKKEVFFLNQRITNPINKRPTNVGDKHFLTLTLKNKPL